MTRYDQNRHYSLWTCHHYVNSSCQLYVSLELLRIKAVNCTFFTECVFQTIKHNFSRFLIEFIQETIEINARITANLNQLNRIREGIRTSFFQPFSQQD